MSALAVEAFGALQPRPELVLHGLRECRHLALHIAQLLAEDRALAVHHLAQSFELLGIALVLALAPRLALLLLDEPFSNLDAQTRERLVVEVRDILRAAGQTALLVTHNEAEAAALADQVSTVGNGRLESRAA